jgi:hypothetical protein
MSAQVRSEKRAATIDRERAEAVKDVFSRFEVAEKPSWWDACVARPARNVIAGKIDCAQDPAQGRQRLPRVKGNSTAGDAQRGGIPLKTGRTRLRMIGTKP